MLPPLLDQLVRLFEATVFQLRLEIHDFDKIAQRVAVLIFQVRDQLGRR